MNNDFHEAYLCEAYVCGEHKAMIEAGFRWELQEDYVLMEPDLPPMLEGWSALASVGTEGFRVTLEAAGCSKPFEVFLTPDDAKKLAMIISPPPGAPVGPGLPSRRFNDDE